MAAALFTCSSSRTRSNRSSATNTELAISLNQRMYIMTGEVLCQFQWCCATKWSRNSHYRTYSLLLFPDSEKKKVHVHKPAEHGDQYFYLSIVTSIPWHTHLSLPLSPSTPPPLTTSVRRHRFCTGVRGSSAAFRSHTLMVLHTNKHTQSIHMQICAYKSFAPKHGVHTLHFGKYKLSLWHMAVWTVLVHLH